MGRHFAPELSDIDFDLLSSQIESESGLFLDIFDEQDGEHVQIYVD